MVQVSLWRLPKLDPNQDPLPEPSLSGTRPSPVEKLDKPLGEIRGLQAAATAMLWNPSGAGSLGGEEFVTLADGHLKRWALGDGR